MAPHVRIRRAEPWPLKARTRRTSEVRVDHGGSWQSASRLRRRRRAGDVGMQPAKSSRVPIYFHEPAAEPDSPPITSDHGLWRAWILAHLDLDPMSMAHPGMSRRHHFGRCR